MPTIRIQFPEKDSPSTLVLDAPKITLGRRADNTIQIVDRTISAFHAEFIREDDHYRLHDLSSTNGSHVNGEPVTDYHLREACKITFGPVECEFSPETPAQGASVETLPTRVEVDAVRRENEELKGRLSTLQQEIEALRKAAEAGNDEAGTNLLRDEIQRLLQERTELKEAALKRGRELSSIRNDLSRMNRDRQNLQDALSRANAEIANLKQGSAQESPKPAESQPKQEPAAQTPSTPAAPTPLPKPAGLVGIPKPTSVAAAEGAPQAPSKPAMPVAASVGQPRPVSAPSPVARSVSVPAVAAASTPRVVAHAVAKPAATPRSVGGSSGTQKITLPGQSAAGANALPKPAPRPLGAVPVPVAAGAATVAEEAAPAESSQE